MEEQRQTLEAARSIAINYGRRLPDFICTEQVQRTDSMGVRSVTADRLTIQLSYFGEKERQNLIAINGKAADQPLESLEGLITGGQFGSLLAEIFDRSSAADFR